MKITDDKTKYTSAWTYVETAKYVESLNRVIRDKKSDQTVFININEIDQYCKKHNNVRNIYFCMALQRP